MNKFAQLNSAQAAQLFAAYCTAQGLEVSAVVLRADLAELYGALEQQQQIEQEFQRFIAEPSHPRYQSAAWQVSAVSDATSSALPAVNVGQFIRQAPVTALVLLACLLVYLWQQIDWRSSAALLQLTNPAQPWRWFTPMLLHFSLTHLVFNLAWWLYLGRQFEQRLGSATLLGITLFIALLSNAAQYLFGGPSLFGGLSGVLYGLLGYCWIFQRLAPTPAYRLPSGVLVMMLVWLLLCASGLITALGFGSIANAAHVGGLLAGCLAGLLGGALARRHR